jgi:DNA-binding NarL/FixJ family response regulator
MSCVTAKRQRITVLVVDDQQTFRDAMRIAFGLEAGMTVTGAVGGSEAIAQAEGDPPDVVLMDVEMPGMGGVQATRRIHELHPGARVIVLSGHDDDVLKAQAFEAGAVGFLSKQTPMSEIADAIRRVHVGELLFGEDEIHRLNRHLRRRRHQDATEGQRVQLLTRRQAQLLQLIADGLSTSDAATKLEVSPQTVRTHVSNIMQRLGVHTRLEAVSVAIRHGKVTARF